MGFFKDLADIFKGGTSFLFSKKGTEAIKQQITIPTHEVIQGLKNAPAESKHLTIKSVQEGFNILKTTNDELFSKKNITADIQLEKNFLKTNNKVIDKIVGGVIDTGKVFTVVGDINDVAIKTGSAISQVSVPLIHTTELTGEVAVKVAKNADKIINGIDDGLGFIFEHPYIIGGALAFIILK